jgi:hypothetical protein
MIQQSYVDTRSTNFFAFLWLFVYVAAGRCSYGKALLNALSGVCCHLGHIIWTPWKKITWSCCMNMLCKEGFKSPTRPGCRKFWKPLRLMKVNLYHMGTGDLNHILQGCWPEFDSRVNGLECVVLQCMVSWTAHMLWCTDDKKLKQGI